MSTATQNLERQIDALISAGVDKRNIYREKFTGTSLVRPVLNKMLSEIQTGDIIVIYDLSRISRSRTDLLDLIGKLNTKGVLLHSLMDSWFRMGANDPHAQLLLDFILSLNEFERNIIAARTKEGIAAARERGRKPGRPRGLNPDVTKKVQTIQKMNSEGIYTISEGCNTLGISRATFYKYTK